MALVWLMQDNSRCAQTAKRVAHRNVSTYVWLRLAPVTQVMHGEFFEYQRRLCGLFVSSVLSGADAESDGRNGVHLHIVSI